MSEKQVDGSQEVSSEVSARRKFLRRSSGVAVAVPAAVLLLAAHSKSAEAIAYTFKPPG